MGSPADLQELARKYGGVTAAPASSPAPSAAPAPDLAALVQQYGGVSHAALVAPNQAALDDAQAAGQPQGHGFMERAAQALGVPTSVDQLKAAVLASSPVGRVIRDLKAGGAGGYLAALADAELPMMDASSMVRGAGEKGQRVGALTEQALRANARGDVRGAALAAAEAQARTATFLAGPLGQQIETIGENTGQDAAEGNAAGLAGTATGAALGYLAGRNPEATLNAARKGLAVGADIAGPSARMAGGVALAHAHPVLGVTMAAGGLVDALKAVLKHGAPAAEEAAQAAREAAPAAIPVAAPVAAEPAAAPAPVANPFAGLPRATGSFPPPTQGPPLPTQAQVMEAIRAGASPAEVARVFEAAKAAEVAAPVAPAAATPATEPPPAVDPVMQALRAGATPTQAFDPDVTAPGGWRKVGIGNWYGTKEGPTGADWNRMGGETARRAWLESRNLLPDAATPQDVATAVAHGVPAEQIDYLYGRERMHAAPTPEARAAAAPATVAPAPAEPAAQPAKAPRVPRIVKDPNGNTVTPEDVHLAPEERQVVVDMADHIVKQIVRETREGAGQRVTVPATQAPAGAAGSRDITHLSDTIYVPSAKNGTPLEGLDESPKELRAALERDKGNAIERRIRQAIVTSDEFQEYLARNAADRGEGDASFDPAQFEAPPAPARRGAIERTAAGDQRLIPGAIDASMGRKIRTEGRETEGPLFTQERDAFDRRQAAAQTDMFGAEPALDAKAVAIRDKVQDFNRRGMSAAQITETLQHLHGLKRADARAMVQLVLSAQR